MRWKCRLVNYRSSCAPMEVSKLAAKCTIIILAAYFASAEVVEHTFHVGNLAVDRLCQRREIIAANGGLPGPTIEIREGDTLVVNAINESPYNLTLHWHGIFQILSGWADGPSYVTQCPIQPGGGYTYRFNVVGQEGTLWWHAHFQWLRATVYGALVIRPRHGRSYPFPEPHGEFPILLGEWWNRDVVEVENEAAASGGAPNISDALTINGLPGDLYPCSSNQMHEINVVRGKTYLLRIVNAALNTAMFFKIAKHEFKVVAVDASYTNPYATDVIVISPGQTVDALMVADQNPSSYFIASRAYASNLGIPFDSTTTRALLVYSDSRSPTPSMPSLPAFNDTPTAHTFFTKLTGLTTSPFWSPVPRQVHHRMFVTIGLGLIPCAGNATCAGPLGMRLEASMNNASFQTGNKLSMLEAFFSGAEGIYTPDFPATPPVAFDYTNTSLSFSQPLVFTAKSTKVTQLKYNSVVEMVLQNTALVGIENHPMHLHGFDFYVLAQGFGNYNANRDTRKFNMYNPQVRNTIGVPVGGWAAIRFRANNPGVWLMHCHLDVHLPMGLATAFVVQNGGTPDTTLPPPPLDFPRC